MGALTVTAVDAAGNRCPQSQAFVVKKRSEPVGAISGTVTDAGAGQGLANPQVSAFTSWGGRSGSATTAADGSYTVPGLVAADDYQVCFYASGATGGSSDATGYGDQYYFNQPTSGTPTPVAVTAGVTTSNMNAALVGTPAVSGQRRLPRTTARVPVAP